MKDVFLKSVTPSKNKDTKWDVIKTILLALGIIAGGFIIFKASMETVINYHVKQAHENKANCVGDFNTIPCHQLKIEQLLLESRKPKQ